MSHVGGTGGPRTVAVSSKPAQRLDRVAAALDAKAKKCDTDFLRIGNAQIDHNLERSALAVAQLATDVAVVEFTAMTPVNLAQLNEALSSELRTADPRGRASSKVGDGTFTTGGVLGRSIANAEKGGKLTKEQKAVLAKFAALTFLRTETQMRANLDRACPERARKLPTANNVRSVFLDTVSGTPPLDFMKRSTGFPILNQAIASVVTHMNDPARLPPDAGTGLSQVATVVNDQGCKDLEKTVGLINAMSLMVGGTNHRSGLTSDAAVKRDMAVALQVLAEVHRLDAVQHHTSGVLERYHTKTTGQSHVADAASTFAEFVGAHDDLIHLLAEQASARGDRAAAEKFEQVNEVLQATHGMSMALINRSPLTAKARAWMAAAREDPVATTLAVAASVLTVGAAVTAAVVSSGATSIAAASNLGLGLAIGAGATAAVGGSVAGAQLGSLQSTAGAAVAAFRHTPSEEEAVRKTAQSLSSATPTTPPTTSPTAPPTAPATPVLTPPVPPMPTAPPSVAPSTPPAPTMRALRAALATMPPPPSPPRTPTPPTPPAATPPTPPPTSRGSSRRSAVVIDASTPSSSTPPPKGGNSSS